MSLAKDGIVEQANNLISELGTDVPVWAASLISLVQGLVSEIKTLNERVIVVCKLESLIAVQENVTKHLVEDNERLNEELSNLRIQVDNNEHNRNINLVLHGVPEEKGEDTQEVFVKIISENIPVPLGIHEIARKGRLRQTFIPSHAKPRPIIVRFHDELKKIKIYKSKKHLKGKKFTLAENLTECRYGLFKKAS